MLYPKNNTHNQSNNMPHHIIPPEGINSDKMKEAHFQVKCMSKYSILHMNQIHHRPYIHPYFQAISLIVINIHNNIWWLMRNNQNWVTGTLDIHFTCNLTLRTILINQNLGPHQNNKMVKSSSRGE